MNKGILVVISGPSGSGKGTVVKRMKELREDIGVSVSATTRSPREGEVHGREYYFITHADFEEKLAQGEILEHTVYLGNYYGTPKSEVDRVVSAGNDLILEIEVEGAAQIKKLYPDAVTIMLIPPTLEELRARLEGRGSEDQAAVEKRLCRALEEIKLAGEYDFVVVNENGKIDECASKILEIVDAERSRSSRMTETINAFCLSDN